MKNRKIPLRMCLGCQEMKPKKELLRLVKTPEGLLEFDPTSKKNGRGAYICSQQECLEKARRYKKFEKTFGMKISDDALRELERQLNSS